MSESPAPLFGELLVKLGLVTPAQVKEALSLQALSGQRVGEALVSLGYVTRDELDRALSGALGWAPRSPLERPPLGELLLGLKYVTVGQLDEALRKQQLDDRRLGETLIEMGVCDHRQVFEALSLQQRMGPLAEVEAAKPASSVRAPTVRVMLIDDSPLSCELVEEGLVPQGLQVISYHDPFRALEDVYRVKPDIVVTDLEMPGIDGAELCRRLKVSPARSIPVIILTSNDGDELRMSGFQAGADDFVVKNASMRELGARIHAVVRRSGEAEKLRRLFARYTSDAVVDQVLKAGEVVLTGEKREVTVLFADLRNFTALAENLPPEEVVAILNDGLGRLADAVLAAGGTLDKFLGDGLMAVFGAPIQHPDDPQRAVDAARTLLQTVEQLNAQMQEDYQAGRRAELPPVLELGIGINTGMAVVGSIGNARRAEYTCIGDAINIASRLCALAGRQEILIGEGTRARLAHAGQLEPLPPVKLKGKSQAVPLFRLQPS